MLDNLMQNRDGTVDPNRVMQALGEVISKAMTQEKAQTVGAPVGPYVHGPGGLFGVRGLSRDIISTHTQLEGLASVLPMQGSDEINPLFPYITGFLRSDQQEKDGVCDDPEEAGNFKTCIQTTTFGRKEFKTRQVEVNRIGQRINRGEFLDLRLANSPLVAQMGGILQQSFALSNQKAALGGREMLMRILEVGVAFQRWTAPQVYTGNPGNNSAGGGYKEFTGLDLLISTTKIDALTGDNCPSLYADVKDFNYVNVADFSANYNIVTVMTYLVRILRRRAVQTNLAPVQLALVMREPLFYELTRVWPCLYMTDSCGFQNSDANAGMTINDEKSVAMRDALREGKYLLIDGMKFPVIIDDSITEETTADNAAIALGGFSSDIYVVPMTARGGTLKTLYWEYYDYREDVLPAARDANLPFWFWSDAGRFLWGLKAPDNWCLELICKFEPRLILKTPQLSGRLQNVVYIPLQHPNDPLPSQPYFVNGGNSTGYPTPSPYSEWNLSGPGIGA